MNTMDVTDVAGAYSAFEQHKLASDASMAVLAQTLKAETLSADGLIGSMPQLPPLGNLGQNLDVKA